MLFTKFKSSPAQEVIHALLSNSTVQSNRLCGYDSCGCSSNHANSGKKFIDMKLVKTRLRNRLGGTSLDQAMIVSIEGLKTLDNERLYC